MTIINVQHRTAQLHRCHRMYWPRAAQFPAHQLTDHHFTRLGLVFLSRRPTYSCLPRPQGCGKTFEDEDTWRKHVCDNAGDRRTPTPTAAGLGGSLNPSRRRRTPVTPNVSNRGLGPQVAGAAAFSVAPPATNFHGVLQRRPGHLKGRRWY